MSRFLENLNKYWVAPLVAIVVAILVCFALVACADVGRAQEIVSSPCSSPLLWFDGEDDFVQIPQSSAQPSEITQLSTLRQYAVDLSFYVAAPNPNWGSASRMYLVDFRGKTGALHDRRALAITIDKAVDGNYSVHFIFQYWDSSLSDSVNFASNFSEFTVPLPNALCQPHRVVLERTGNSLKFHVDGVQAIRSTNLQLSGKEFQPDEPMHFTNRSRIGSFSGGTGLNVMGYIGEIRIWDKPAQRPVGQPFAPLGSHRGLLAYWPMEEPPQYRKDANGAWRSGNQIVSNLVTNSPLQSGFLGEHDGLESFDPTPVVGTAIGNHQVVGN